jgi:hypothetical protein
VSTDDRIDVRKYDAAARALGSGTPDHFEEAVAQSGLSLSTVQKIWDGTISRPPVVVLERLRQPRRCPVCGSLCRDWPCVTCEMRRRRKQHTGSPLRFIYATAPK